MYFLFQRRLFSHGKAQFASSEFPGFFSIANRKSAVKALFLPPLRSEYGRKRFRKYKKNVKYGTWNVCFSSIFSFFFKHFIVINKTKSLGVKRPWVQVSPLGPSKNLETAMVSRFFLFLFLLMKNSFGGIAVEYAFFSRCEFSVLKWLIVKKARNDKGFRWFPLSFFCYLEGTSPFHILVNCIYKLSWFFATAAWQSIRFAC